MRAFARDWTCIVHGDTCPEAGMGWRCKVAVDWGAEDER